MLLYTSRDAAGSSLFRMRGLLPLRGMLVSARRWAGRAGLTAAPRRPGGLHGCTSNHAHQHPQDQAQVL